MFKIFLTTAIALATATIFGAVVGQNLMLLMYIPMNIILPLLIMVLMYDYFISKIQPGVLKGIFVFLAVAVVFFTAMFSIDILFFNNSIGAHELFRKDYLGYIFILAPSVVIVPIAFSKVSH